MQDATSDQGGVDTAVSAPTSSGILARLRNGLRAWRSGKSEPAVRILQRLRLECEATNEAKAKAAHAWRQCWPVLANPCPGIAVCMPLVMLTPLHDAHLWMEPRSMPRVLVRTVWLGWRTGGGFVLGVNHGHMDTTPMMPPGQGWTPSLAHSLVKSHHKDWVVKRRGRGGSRGPRTLWDYDGYRLQTPELSSRLCGAFVRELMATNTTTMMSHIMPELDVYVQESRLLSDFGCAGPGLTLDRDIDLDSELGSLCGQLDFMAGLGGQAVSSAALIARNRYQYMRDHPPFAHLAQGPLQASIDAGLPAMQALAAHLSCPVRVVRALVHAPWDPSPHESNRLLRVLVDTRVGLVLLEAANPQVLAHVKDDKANPEANPLYSLYGLAGAVLGRPVDDMLEHRANPTPDPFDDFGFLDFQEEDSTPKRWVYPRPGENLNSHDAMSAPMRAMLAHVGASMPTQSTLWKAFATTANTWQVFEHMQADFERELLSPARLHGGCHYYSVDQADPGDSARTILASLGVPRLVHLVEVYRGMRGYNPIPGHDLPGPERTGAASQSWRVPCQPRTSPATPVHAARTLRALGCQAELDHEAVHMRNCIAGYGEQCQQNRSAILSVGDWVRDDNSLDASARAWIPTSSAMIVGRGGRLVCMQHHGFRNSEPSGADKEAVQWWLAQVEAGAIAVDPHVPERYEDAMSLDLEYSVPYYLGGRWQSTNSRRHRWHKWSRILDTRVATPGLWLEGLPRVAGMPTGRLDVLLAQVVALDGPQVVALDGPQVVALDGLA